MKTRTFLLVALGMLGSSIAAYGAAELSVVDAAMRPGHTASVSVHGLIEGESTFGVTVMVTLVPRQDGRGEVEFTPAAPVAKSSQQRTIRTTEGPAGAKRVSVALAESADVDIAKLGDPWAESGSFTRFDTDRTTSKRLNGCVLDNGTFLPAPTTYAGPIARFGVRADAGASGTWDVVLSSKKGASGWEGVTTTLVAGTLTITPDACVAHADCDDGMSSTVDTCVAGTCSSIETKETRPARARSNSETRMHHSDGTPTRRVKE